MLLINLLKRSIKIELQDFLAFGLKQEISYTKSAFCQSRDKIQPIFFRDLNNKLVELLYLKNKEKIKKWKDLLLLGIDGSTAYLPNNKETKDYFGTQINQFGEVVMARIIKFHDVLNDISVFSKITAISKSEVALLIENIKSIPQDCICILDRGFPSFLLCYTLNKNKNLFVMRAKLSFNKLVQNFVESELQDTIFEWTPTIDAIKDLKSNGYEINQHTSLKIRLVKIWLKTGELEVLMTNLYDDSNYTISDLSELYFKRWGVETRFDADKNIAQLEEFSGQKPISIEQDFYCTEFVLNLQTMIAMDCEEELKVISERRAHQYKINKNVSIGSMKYRIVELFCSQKPIEVYEKLKKLFLDSLEPVRPERSNPRNFKNIRRKGKYKTLNNYKRAI